MADQVTWTISPPPVLVLDAPGFVFDLRASLPAGVRRGGSFQVTSAGAALPPGVVLTSAGLLSLTSAAQAGTTTGVIFSYDEPS